MSQNYIEKILRAKVYDVAKETPLDFAPSLSERLANRVFLKREDLQSVFSFKLRGAYNKMSQLDEPSRAKGVALSAKRLDINALIIMPTTTPEIKKAELIAAIYADMPRFLRYFLDDLHRARIGSSGTGTKRRTISMMIRCEQGLSPTLAAIL